MTDPTTKIERLEDLKPDPQNANKGTARGATVIENSVRQRGAGRSGLAAADGTMIAGSQTLQKMAELGIPVRTVHTQGDEWVVVVRDDIAPGSEAATLLALEDNRSAQVGLDWDTDLLATLAADAPDLLAGLWRDTELSALLGTGEPMDPSALWAGMPEYENEAQAARSLHIHFLTEADCTRFCAVLELAITPNTKTVWYPAPPIRDKFLFEGHGES